MSPNRLWTTIATAIVLSAVGSPGVWAEPQANCSAGWEWVGSIHYTTSPPFPRQSAYGVLMLSSVFIRGTCSSEQELTRAGFMFRCYRA